MKYLDERIILTVPNLTIPEDGLYQYEIGITNEWLVSDPYFVGNCFIPKDSTERTIDITDIVRNEIDFENSVDFQEEWQVRIKVGEDYYYSNSETVLPIYRYPNRKAEMETPIELNKDDWYIPSLQGFDAQKKAKMLPHIPFVSTEEVSYDLLVNYGTLDQATKDILKLYTGVEKDLNINNNSLTHTSYTLKDLFSGSKEVETIAWDYYQGNLFYNFGVDMMPIKDYADDTNCSKYITSLAPLQFKLTTYKQIDTVEYGNGEDDYTVYTISEYPLDVTLRVNDIKEFFDVYLNANDGGYINLFPPVVETCNGTVHITGDYEPNNYIDLIANTTAGEISGNYILERDTVGGDTFKIEIGKTQAAGDKPDKTFENLTIGDTIEFDDTSDSQWLKLYDSTGTLIDTLTFNADIMEEGSWKEYAIRLEEMDTYLALFPLQQVYNFTLDYRTFVEPKSSVQNENIEMRVPIQNYNSVYFDNTTGKVDVLQGTGSVQYVANNRWTVRFSYTDVRQFGHPFANIYGITSTGEVVYFKSTPNALLRFNHPSQIRGIYIISMANVNDELNIEQIVFAPIDDRKYADGFYYNLRGNITSNGLAVSFFDFINVHYTNITPYTITPVASIDYCPARYYLQWRDRYGSQQTQPFGKTETYSENFTSSEVKNYQNVRRLANVDIQPKWKINSGWLNDSVYPYYESLFVSPWLRLYDAKEDKTYNVIITDSEYTEKTFRNQSATLFNLELNLELNQTQKILY